MSAPNLTVQVNGGAAVSGDQLNTYVQGCDNVAQLRAFIGIQGVQVYLRGYTTPNDGGSGSFYWNASGTAPDDGGVTTIVPTGSTAGEWTRLGLAGTTVGSLIVTGNATVGGTLGVTGNATFSGTVTSTSGTAAEFALTKTGSSAGTSYISNDGGMHIESSAEIYIGAYSGAPIQLGNGALTSGTGAFNLTSASSVTVPSVAASDNSAKAISSSYLHAGANGASLVLLGSATASSSATISFTSIPSGYAKYIIYLDLVTYSSNSDFRMQVSENNGSSYLATGYYYGANKVSSSGTGISLGGANAAYISLSATLTNSAIPLGGVLTIGPLGSTGQKSIIGETFYYDGAYENHMLSGAYTGDGNAINAIQFYFGSGNIASGSFYLYGVRSS